MESFGSRNKYKNRAKFNEHYCPKQNLSLDEGMIPTNNSLSIRQYIKDQPTKWDIKTFWVCDSDNGFICNKEAYTGARKDNSEIPQLGVTGNLVARLSKSFSAQKYRVFCDRYYSGIDIVEFLKSTYNIDFIGNIQQNRVGFPRCLVSKKNSLQGGKSVKLNNVNV